MGTARTGWRLAWQAMVRELAPQQKGKGAYVRPGYAFSGGIDEKSAAAATPNSYALYVGNACPWCHRVLLALALRGNPSLVRVVELLDDPERATRGGWVIAPPATSDPVFGARDLYGVYESVSPGFKGRCTAPLLVDARRRTAVCNESAELVRTVLELRPREGTGASSSSSSSSSSAIPPNRANLYPLQHRAEIERLNARIYQDLANGVYRAGFATTQRAFEDALTGVQSSLLELETLLESKRFLCGEHLTEADVRLFPALSRLDAAYHGFFLRGAPLKKEGAVGGLAALFPNLHGWLNDVWELPGVGGTIDVDAARNSYWKNLFPLNPGGIVPPGPSEAAVRTAIDGASGKEVAARRRRRFGCSEVVVDVEEVCVLFSD